MIIPSTKSISIELKGIHTSTAVIISISWVTSPVTVSRLFVTCIVIQTVTATVVDTIISIGTVVALYNPLYVW